MALSKSFGVDVEPPARGTHADFLTRTNQTGAALLCSGGDGTQFVHALAGPFQNVSNEEADRMWRRLVQLYVELYLRSPVLAPRESDVQRLVAGACALPLLAVMMLEVAERTMPSSDFGAPAEVMAAIAASKERLQEAERTGEAELDLNGSDAKTAVLGETKDTSIEVLKGMLRQALDAAKSRVLSEGGAMELVRTSLWCQPGVPAALLLGDGQLAVQREQLIMGMSDEDKMALSDEALEARDQMYMGGDHGRLLQHLTSHMGAVGAADPNGRY